MHRKHHRCERWAIVGALLVLAILLGSIRQIDCDDAQAAARSIILGDVNNLEPKQTASLSSEKRGFFPSQSPPRRGFGDQLFIKRNGTSLVTSDGIPYRFVGINYWYGQALGSRGPGGDRARLRRELDELSARGITNLRIMAGSEGPNTEPYRMVPAMQIEPGVYDEDALEGLDYLLHEMSRRGMRAVMCLTNEWTWSGGLAQYLVWANHAKEIPYHPPEPNGNWNEFMHFTSHAFKDEKVIKMYHDHVRFIVNRNNSVSAKPYKEDPTIMSWELANEPRGMKFPESLKSWVERTAGLIKDLDTNHLVTIGLEGDTPDADYNGVDFEGLNSIESIDYSTIHIWVENWKWYDPFRPSSSYPSAWNKALAYFQDHAARSNKIGKPLVFEEFGLARDSNIRGRDRYDPSTSVMWRDQYFDSLLSWICLLGKDKNSAVVGANVWAYGGESWNAVKPGRLWSPGDTFTGDPPHEAQGWYSIYSKDHSTLDILEKYSECIQPARPAAPTNTRAMADRVEWMGGGIQTSQYP
jgi:mannan endo-1,4-beta-mannosidase